MEKEYDTLKICVQDIVIVTDKFGYVSFSCTLSNEWLVIEAPELYSPVSTYWTPTLARGPSTKLSFFNSSKKQFA